MPKVTAVMPSLFQQHVSRWVDCQLCHLCHGRDRVVLARGVIPCDVLLVGEAPGESENDLGYPFAGPAGHLLDSILDQALPIEHADGLDQPPTGPVLDLAFTNLVGCIPREEGGVSKATEPDDEAIEACKPRLEEMIEIARPRLIVTVGRLARDWLEQGYKYSVKLPNQFSAMIGTPQADITHPAAILRANSAQQGLMIRKCVVTLTNAFQKLTQGDQPCQP